MGPVASHPCSTPVIISNERFDCCILASHLMKQSHQVQLRPEGDRMATRKKSSSRKYGKAAGKSVESAMRREKKGTLRSGKGGRGGVVKSRKQAIAIGLSEARKKGAKVPKKKSS